MSKKPFEYEITDIGNGTYLINEFYSTMFILCGEERALVIDCGVGASDFKSVIESITKLPYDVVMTHSHVDHIGGRGQFTDIYVTRADAPYIKGVNLLIRKGYGVLNKIGMGTNFSNVKMKRVKAEPAVHIIDEGDIFDLGGGRVIKVWLTPGHTVGSASFLDVKNRTVFIGDIANEYLLMYLPHCTTVDEMIGTVEKLLEKNEYDTVWSSHHTQPHTRADIERFLAGARQVSSSRRRNTLLPFIKANTYEGAKLLYRTSYIHKKGNK